MNILRITIKINYMGSIIYKPNDYSRQHYKYQYFLYIKGSDKYDELLFNPY